MIFNKVVLFANKIFSLLIGLIKGINFEISFDDITKEDLIEDLNGEELDLEPVRQFMEDYIGQIIVDVSGKQDFTEIGDKARATIIMSVDLEGEDLKFKLAKLNGQTGGYLVISPTKYGMFKEKLSGEGMDVYSIYQITFYDGYSLEYLDTQGKGIVRHQES
jgi:hypothetical protein